METKPSRAPDSLPARSLLELRFQLELIGRWIERGRSGGPGNEKWARVVPALIRVSVAVLYDCVAVQQAAVDAGDRKTRRWMVRHVRWLDSVCESLEAGDSGPIRTASKRSRRPASPR